MKSLLLLSLLAANGLQLAASAGNSVTLTWNASETAGVTYDVYRDGLQIASNINALDYTDANVPNGPHAYTVRANMESVDSNTASITVGSAPPPPPPPPAGGPLLVVFPATPFTPTHGTFFSTTLTATGGAPPYHWKITGGTLLGLTLSDAGVISGFAQGPDLNFFYVRVTDSRGSSISPSQGFELKVQ